MSRIKKLLSMMVIMAMLVMIIGPNGVAVEDGGNEGSVDVVDVGSGSDDANSGTGSGSDDANNGAGSGSDDANSSAGSGSDDANSGTGSGSDDANSGTGSGSDDDNGADMNFVMKSRSMPLTVSANNLEVVYDGAEHTVTATSNDADAEISYSLNQKEWSTNAPAFTNVKRNADGVVESYVVYIKADNDSETATGSCTVTIKPQDVIVTAKSKDKTYGEADPELEADVEGTIGEDKVAYTLIREEGENAGGYTITFKDPQKAQGNYNVDFKNGTLTIKPLTGLTVKADDLEVVYDGAAHKVTATSNDADAEIFYSLDEQSWSTNAPEFTNVKRNADGAVGSYVVYIKAEKENYETAKDSYTVFAKM